MVRDKLERRARQAGYHATIALTVIVLVVVGAILLIAFGDIIFKQQLNSAVKRAAAVDEINEQIVDLNEEQTTSLESAKESSSRILSYLENTRFYWVDLAEYGGHSDPALDSIFNIEVHDGLGVALGTALLEIDLYADAKDRKWKLATVCEGESSTCDVAKSFSKLAYDQALGTFYATGSGSFALRNGESNKWNVFRVPEGDTAAQIDFYGAVFATSDTGWAYGENFSVFQTTDRGKSWEEIEIFGTASAETSGQTAINGGRMIGRDHVLFHGQSGVLAIFRVERKDDGATQLVSLKPAFILKENFDLIQTSSGVTADGTNRDEKLATDFKAEVESVWFDAAYSKNEGQPGQKILLMSREGWYINVKPGVDNDKFELVLGRFDCPPKILACRARTVSSFRNSSSLVAFGNFGGIWYSKNDGYDWEFVEFEDVPSDYVREGKLPHFFDSETLGSSAVAVGQNGLFVDVALPEGENPELLISIFDQKINNDFLFAIGKDKFAQSPRFLAGSSGRVYVNVADAKLLQSIRNFEEPELVANYLNENSSSIPRLKTEPSIVDPVLQSLTTTIDASLETFNTLERKIGDLHQEKFKSLKDNQLDSPEQLLWINGSRAIVVVMSVLLIRWLISVYGYNIRVVRFYRARADALDLHIINNDPFIGLSEIMSPDKLDILVPSSDSSSMLKAVFGGGKP